MVNVLEALEQEPPLVYPLVRGAGKPGVQDEDAPPRIAVVHGPSQGWIIGQPQALSKPVDSMLGPTVVLIGVMVQSSVRPLTLVVGAIAHCPTSGGPGGRVVALPAVVFVA